MDRVVPALLAFSLASADTSVSRASSATRDLRACRIGNLLGDSPGNQSRLERSQAEMRIVPRRASSRQSHTVKQVRRRLRAVGVAPRS
jgi:hypothetical protein